MHATFFIPPAWQWRIVILLFGFVGVSFWLFPFAYHRLAKESFENYVAELAAKGESLEVDDLRPPPVGNPKDNVTEAPVFADFLARCRADPEVFGKGDPVWGALDPSAVPGFSVDHIRGEKNQVRYLTYPALSQGFDPPDELAAARAILAHGETHAATLDEIRGALARPGADFQVTYGDFTAGFPELNTFNSFGKLLHRQGRAALLLGRNDLAKANAIALLRFSRHFGNQATLIHGLIGIVLSDFAIALIHEGLAGGKWSDPDLNAFAGELEERWMETAFLRALRMERVGMLDSFERSVKEHELPDAFTPRWVRALLRIPDLRKGWLYDTMEFYSRTMQESVLEDDRGRPL